MRPEGREPLPDKAGESTLPSRSGGEEGLRGGGQIATNAGLDGSVILEKVKNSKPGIGFDAAKEEYVDMKKAGIVDPTKVTRSAIQNAESVASMILTTESIVTELKEPKCSCGHDHGGPEMDPGAMAGLY